MSEAAVSDRAAKLLKHLIERYIRDGQPVGSKTLSDESGLGVSAATVRNIMAELEERGYLTSPHTSAGRIPTPAGYRLFVDTLVTVAPPAQTLIDELRQQLGTEKTTPELISTASNLLASISAQAALVSLPRRDVHALRQVEFLPLSDRRVLVILVVDEREVQNRVINTCRDYSEPELTAAANYINSRFAGRNLDTIRHELLSAMGQDKASIDRYMQASYELAAGTFTSEPAQNSGYILAGEKSLLDSAGADGITQIRALFEAFEQKKDILDLVDRCIDAKDIQLFIGEEAGHEVFGGFSVITAPYEVDGQPLGVLGVIGPTRMAYNRVIPLVDVTARMLSGALRSV